HAGSHRSRGSGLRSGGIIKAGPKNAAGAQGRNIRELESEGVINRAAGDGTPQAKPGTGSITPKGHTVALRIGEAGNRQVPGGNSRLRRRLVRSGLGPGLTLGVLLGDQGVVD